MQAIVDDFAKLAIIDQRIKACNLQEYDPCLRRT
jgi:hypothetical protein